MKTAFYIEQLVQREAALAETAALLQASREEFQALSRRLVDALEKQRAALARNLHDEAGQALTVLGLGLVRLARSGHLDPDAARQVNDLQELTRSIAVDLRRVATDLRPASLDRVGLVAALQQYIDLYQTQTGLQVELTATNLAGEHYNADVETILYRIEQEALTNAARHAQASRVQVVVSDGDRHLRLSVKDDGAGFDMEEALRRGRLGLLGMRERAAMLGGTVKIESARGAGTTVSVEMPVEQAGNL